VGSGFATKVIGGQLPAGSGATAFESIACQTRTGIKRHNHVAAVDLPGVGRIAGADTDVWTKAVGASRHSYAVSSIASVVLSDSPLGKLRLGAITARSHAWHDARGFHAGTRTEVGKLEFVPPAGRAQALDLPTPGQPVTVPGVATITIGRSVHRTPADGGAVARAEVVNVHLIPTDTTVLIGRSLAKALPGAKHGRFFGYSAGTQVDVAQGVLTSGRNPLVKMPCTSTNGEERTSDDLGVNLGGQLVVDAAQAAQWSQRFAGRSKAWERGKVAGVNLGNGALTVDAVVGKATVTRTSDGQLSTSTRGTTVGTITANGQEQTFPDTGVLEIPGVAKLEQKVTTKVPGGIKVVGLRITLLDGSLATVDLGVAQAAIHR
jgi:hypothetical protein